jgi:hypothetical protein
MWAIWTWTPQCSPMSIASAPASCTAWDSSRIWEGIAGAVGFQHAAEGAQLVARAEAARRVECHSSQ